MHSKITVQTLTFASLILIMILVSLSVSSSALDSPDSYAYGECELVAKEFRAEFGGDLVFIQPLKLNGAFDFGEYNGHWINRLYIRGNKDYFYFDWANQRIFSDMNEVKNWYRYQTGAHSEVYVIGTDSVPFGIHYH